MSTVARTLELFHMGIPVRQIREMVGLDAATITAILTRSGQRPQHTATTSFTMRVCPFFDECRDCTFQRCEFDKFRVVTV